MTTPDECLEDDEREVACGLNGIVEQYCYEGSWEDDSPCIEYCFEDTTDIGTCGFNGEGTQPLLCVEGYWETDGACVDPHECKNGTVNSTDGDSCGLNGAGVRALICTDGFWEERGDCIDPDVCTNGVNETTSCGFNGRGSLDRSCVGGQWQNNTSCDDPDICTDGHVEKIACVDTDFAHIKRSCVNGDWEDGECTGNSIAMSPYHGCVVRNSGHVVCWAKDAIGNAFGQASGTHDDSQTVPENIRNMTYAEQVATAHQSTCVLTNAGEVSCWGKGAHGQLGRGHEMNSVAHWKVSGLSNATQIVAGANHYCALIHDGTVQCWGSNSHGQLGDGTPDDRHVPTAVSQLSNIAEVYAAENTTCARVRESAMSLPIPEQTLVYCWGDNSHNNAGSSTAPAVLYEPVATHAHGFLHVATSATVFCGITSERQNGWAPDHTPMISIQRMRCMGGAAPAQADGNGTVSHEELHHTQISDISNFGRPVIQLVSGGLGEATKMCAITQAAKYVNCWGDNTHNSLGRANENLPIGDMATPGLLYREIPHPDYPYSTILSVVKGVLGVAVGHESICLINHEGKLECTGKSASRADGRLSPLLHVPTHLY